MAEHTIQPRGLKLSRTIILVGGAIVLFLLTYFLAWWSAYRLSARYIQDADASYNDSRYLDALLGYEKFDPAQQQYQDYGGYLQVERIWKNKYAVPVPSEVKRAQNRIDEIIYQRLTIEDAEQFVQENIGRNNPAMGLIYLRLGELYEANGQLDDAEDIYVSIPDLFPNDHVLIERARQDLENLQKSQPES